MVEVDAQASGVPHTRHVAEESAGVPEVLVRHPRTSRRRLRQHDLGESIRARTPNNRHLVAVGRFSNTGGKETGPARKITDMPEPPFAIVAR